MPKKPKSPRRPKPAPAAVTPPAEAPPSDTRSLRGRRSGIVIATLLVLAAAVWGLWQWTTAVPGGSDKQAQAPARYVGAQSCAGCHAQAYGAWHGSQHDLAMQVAAEGAVLGDFADAKFSYAGISSTFSRRDGKFFVNTDGPDGALHDYEIRYAFGVSPLQQYLIELPGGRLQALSIAWDSRPREAGGQRWFHLYPGQNIKAGDPLHWTGVNQNWNFMCAECHSTDLRKNFDAKSHEFKTTWAELNVACEACHGPGSRHLEWAKSKDDKAMPDKGLAIALDERKGVAWTPAPGSATAHRSRPRESSRELDTCARCHARAARISDDYIHGKPPLDTHRLSLLEEGLYWNDGQMRDEVYNWGSFVQSRMHAQGVSCSDCHDPHTLKLKASGNAVCGQCHQSERYDAPAHTHHAVGTAGASCSACHMPTTTYMVIDPRHDHSFRIPRPDLSVKLGVPNACTNCHTKQSAQWAADALVHWTGKTPVGYQNFAEAFAAGSSGAPGAREALLAIVGDSSQQAIVRASAIARLGRWLTPTVADSLGRALNDPDANVRLAAVEALANGDAAMRQRYLLRMVGDSTRAVRIEAARALAAEPEAAIPSSYRADLARALSEYVAVQTGNADRPEGRMALANLSAARGDMTAAVAEYRQALEIDPTFAAAYMNLADAYRTQGAEDKAEAVLREGLARVPNSAALHHALGLSLVRQQKSAAALKELAEGARLEPANSRYAYVLAVALYDGGRQPEAMRTLTQALDAHPYDRDLLLALSQYAAVAGRREAALGYVRRLQELEPEDPQVARLAGLIGGQSGR